MEKKKLNYGSPFSKDHKKGKKDDELEKFKPEKLKISVATAKKILKPLKIDVGLAEAKWVNQYVENAVRARCLPLALLSNDFPAEVQRTFGEQAADFLETMLRDFQLTSPKNVPALDKP